MSDDHSNEYFNISIIMNVDEHSLSILTSWRKYGTNKLN